ncbi:MAG: hypothetical protein ACOX3V_00875 [Bacillota bacterium]
MRGRRIEFCWECEESDTCERWQAHRDAGKRSDSFKCYQKLEEDILFIRTHGIDPFIEEQETRRNLLGEMLFGFNDGRSKSYYCIAATILEVDELRGAIHRASAESDGLDAKAKARTLRDLLEAIAQVKRYCLRLRN